jgi:hypothetical protein
MITTYIPDTVENAVSLRKEAKAEFMDFWTHGGSFSNKFDDPLPPPLSTAEAKAKRELITIEDVKKFVDDTGGMNGRLRWFEVYARDTTLYKYIAKPLLSISSTGSMDVERYAKPLKYCIQTKEKNRTSDDFASMVLRILINVRNVKAAKNSLVADMNASP